MCLVENTAILNLFLILPKEGYHPIFEIFYKIFHLFSVQSMYKRITFQPEDYILSDLLLLITLKHCKSHNC